MKDFGGKDDEGEYEDDDEASSSSSDLFELDHLAARSNKVTVKVLLPDERMKQEGLKAVSGLQGVESISMNMKDQKLTVIGGINPVDVVNKLKKLCPTEIVSVGPAKEEKKKEKEEPKKDKKKKEPEKKEPKKEKKPDEKEEPKEEKKPEKKEPKKGKKNDEMAEFVSAYQAYNPYMTQQHDFVRSVEEDPNACAIL